MRHLLLVLLAKFIRDALANGCGDVAKRFVYLIEDPVKVDIPGLVETCHRDIIWLTYKEPVLHPSDYDIFMPVSTWQSGRNALLSSAIRRMSDSDWVIDYNYFIFKDGDISLSINHKYASSIHGEKRDHMGFNSSVMKNALRENSNGEKSAWDVFESMLMTAHPSYGNGHTLVPPNLEQERPNPDHPGYPYYPIRLKDGMFAAFHRDTLPALLPYSTFGDDISAHFGNYIANILANMFYIRSMIYSPIFVATNPTHATHPNNCNFALPFGYLRDNLNPVMWKKYCGRDSLSDLWDLMGALPPSLLSPSRKHGRCLLIPRAKWLSYFNTSGNFVLEHDKFWYNNTINHAYLNRLYMNHCASWENDNPDNVFNVTIC